MAKTKKKGINGRAKGKRGEREVASLFKEWWGSDFTSTPLSGGFATQQFREDWNACGDLVTPDDTFPFTVEVKNQEGWSFDQLLTTPSCKIWAWWEQCVGETPEGKIPLLVFKKNRMDWHVIMDTLDSRFVSAEEWNGQTIDKTKLIYLADSLTGDPLVLTTWKNFSNTKKEYWL